MKTTASRASLKLLKPTPFTDIAASLITIVGTITLAFIVIAGSMEWYWHTALTVLAVLLLIPAGLALAALVPNIRLIVGRCAGNPEPPALPELTIYPSKNGKAERTNVLWPGIMLNGPVAFTGSASGTEITEFGLADALIHNDNVVVVTYPAEVMDERAAFEHIIAELDRRDYRNLVVWGLSLGGMIGYRFCKYYEAHEKQPLGPLQGFVPMDTPPNWRSVRVQGLIQLFRYFGAAGPALQRLWEGFIWKLGCPENPALRQWMTTEGYGEFYDVIREDTRTYQALFPNLAVIARGRAFHNGPLRCPVIILRHNPEDDGVLKADRAAAGILAVQGNARVEIISRFTLTVLDEHGITAELGKSYRELVRRVRQYLLGA